MTGDEIKELFFSLKELKCKLDICKHFPDNPGYRIYPHFDFNETPECLYEIVTKGRYKPNCEHPITKNSNGICYWGYHFRGFGFEHLPKEWQIVIEIKCSECNKISIFTSDTYVMDEEFEC